MRGGRVRGASSKGKIVWAEKSAPLGPVLTIDSIPGSLTKTLLSVTQATPKEAGHYGVQNV